MRPRNRRQYFAETRRLFSPSSGKIFLLLFLRQGFYQRRITFLEQDTSTIINKDKFYLDNLIYQFDNVRKHNFLWLGDNNTYTGWCQTLDGIQITDKKDVAFGRRLVQRLQAAACHIFLISKNKYWPTLYFSLLLQVGVISVTLGRIWINK